jgi:uncharacterized SAM-binding protein YcdF (DUF218 family)
VSLAWLFAVGASIVVAGRDSAPGNADAAIVLGAAAYPSGPSPVFEERIRHGLELYRAGRVHRLIATGGHGNDATYSESETAKAWLIKQGVPAGAILTETRSHTTRQNLVEAQRIMREQHLSSAFIVSDPLHMKRAMAMARDLGMDAKSSPTPTTRYRSLSSQAGFLLREIYFIHHYWLIGE